MLYLSGIAIAFFLLLLLMSKKRKSPADNILAVWLFILGIHLSFYYLHTILQHFNYGFLTGLEIPMPLLQGPMLYLYTASSTNQLPKNRLGVWLHFVPVVISYLCMLDFFFLSGEDKHFIYVNNGIGYETFSTLNFYAIILSGVVYIVWSMLLLKRHTKAVMDEFSYTEKINLDWLRYLIYGVSAIWFIIIFSGRDDFIFGTAVAFVFFLGYFGIRQGRIFTHPLGYIEHPVRFPSDLPAVVQESTEPLSREEEEELEIAPSENEFSGPEQEVKKKYVKSGLTKDAAAAIHKKLVESMNMRKYYTNAELSLATLADELEVHPNILSQVINAIEGKNFYDFISSWRVEEFKQKVSSPGNQKFTLLGLALECGFNSKTSFNRQFKKMTGVSPTEYLQTVRLSG